MLPQRLIIIKRMSRSGSIPCGNLRPTLDILFRGKCYQSFTLIQRRLLEKEDALDMYAYKDWFNKPYDEQLILCRMLSSVRTKKKNAGEVSITIIDWEVVYEFDTGCSKKDYSDYVLYFVENLLDELKQEIRSRLVAICHGADQAQSSLKIYSYKETVKEFVKRYKTNKDVSKDRKKGMIGELLVHVILELEERFTAASPFFNMEELSFKKGYDIALFETATNELWIAEV